MRCLEVFLYNCLINLEDITYPLFQTCSIFIFFADTERMEFYYKAVMENKALFEDKIVLDVGCGLGFLSILAAKAGAKKVYAVEASSQVFVLAQLSFAKSGYESVIEAVNKPIEEVVIENRYVDIIISEWMGYW